MKARLVVGAYLLFAAARAWSEESSLNAGQSFKDCPDCPEMVVVPAGKFTMGSPESEPERLSSEGPQHVVRIANSFAVGVFPVTRDEFDAFVKDSNYRLDDGCHVWNGFKWMEDSAKSYRSPGFAQTGSHPVVCVNWNDAKAYVQWLSKKTDQSYRLLSEAEREYVTRAGTTTPFWWGTSITPDQANYNGSADPYKGGGEKSVYRQGTVPVKSFNPNGWGLYQVHGNVWEWMADDCFNQNYNGAPADGSAATTGNCKFRELRGGSWDDGPGDLRAGRRGYNHPSFRVSYLGFRVARRISP
jgi:formylglycine-generating enzyme required for sulfatase activity